MALIKLAKDGYGQLELNFAAFRRNGAIEAQCKIADGIDYIENGMLLAVNRKNRTVGYPTGAADEVIALNYTTEHMYDERLAHGLKHFKLDKDTFCPRLGYLATGDKFTTNCVAIASATGEKATVEEVKAALAGNAYGKVENGVITLTNEAEGAIVKVVCATTMPDGQFAVKFIAL